MTPSVTILGGDCLEQLASLPDNSVDSIVTDPPYGLSNTDPAKVAETLAAWVAGDDTSVPKGKGFMGEAWDAFVPPPAVWKECMRVLKPGGHMAVFAGSRTQDLMGLSIRLAGFEIRDSLVWLYGSGFPKGQDLGKAIDKKLGAERKVVGTAKGARNGNGENVDYGAFASAADGTYAVTESGSDEARKWEGWNSQLKPAQEPIILARKPVVGPLVDNVMEHGTGALNIDACRVPTDEDRRRNAKGGENGLNGESTFKIRDRRAEDQPMTNGRYPANVLLDPEAAAALDEQSGTLTSGKMKPTHVRPDRTVYGQHSKEGYVTEETYGDSGGASRFFPVLKDQAKTPKGRYPANVLLDEQAAAALDEQSGYQKDGVAVQRNGGGQAIFGGIGNGENTTGARKDQTYGGGGGASRFFPVFKDQDKASKGRYPANVLLDESAAAALDDQTGDMAVAGNTPDSLRSGTEDGDAAPRTSQVPTYAGGPSVTYQDRGGASRFFPVFKYQAKAPKRERPVVDGVKHPTVKPLALMDWLVTLITPPGGTVLDPFAGSGATLEAARDAGFHSIGMEAHFPYVSLILERLGENR